MKIQNRRTIPEEWYKQFCKLSKLFNLGEPTDMEYYMAFYKDGTTPEQLINEWLEYDKRQAELYLVF